MVCSVRYDLDLTDVTLVCKDGKQVEAHKVVLASTSPFFMELFKRYKHPPTPHIVFILAMVEFLYSGDANIDQENLDEFLADELGLKDFNGTCEEGGVNT